MIWFENIFLRNSAFPGNTEIVISAGLDTLPPRLSKIVGLLFRSDLHRNVTRKEVRAMIEPFGGFVMVYVHMEREGFIGVDDNP